MSGMTERPDEQGASATGPEPAPGDWQSQAPKPIELPPLAEAEEEKRRERSIRGGGAALVVLIIVLALVGTSPFWAPSLAGILPWSPQATADAPALAQLGERVDALAKRQAALEQRLQRSEEQLGGATAAQPTAAALKELGERVAQLEQRPAASAGDADRMAALQEQLRKLGTDEAQNADRLSKIETQANEGGARADEALLLALGQLREELESSRPFATQLGTVNALARSRPELRAALQPLDDAAQAGVPSLAVLRQRFTDEVTPAVLRQAAAPPSANWGDHIWSKLRSLVIVRRVGEGAASSDDPVQAALGRADAALTHGDLAGGVTAVESLPPAAASPAADWLAAARQRLALEQAVARATGQLTARLGGSGDTAPAAADAPGEQGGEH